ncbi:unnamed protein product [Cylindrotheca closterium]|uniref:Uncharacterized protein n=1 Tax=Cylindrotheca closterium TaxID=2856 RepID=A0AAD2FFA9_9STRA|nr:unnamed protein product [Cylindrotheca closterium]
MKIFAKRKKKDASSATKRTSFQSDPIVEELLKKDPSEWNAKQKRMVKRYQQRKAETGDDNNAQKEQQEVPVREESKAEEMTVERVEKEEVKNTEDIEEESEDSDDSDSDSDSGSDNGSDGDSDQEVDENSEEQVELEKETETTAEKEIETTAVQEIETTAKEEPVAETKMETQTPPSTTETETDSDKVDTSHPVYKLLDQLNSKTKRTLSRKLDREGSKALPEVEQEVKKLLGITNETSKKRGADTVGGKPNKKKKVDWSGLPPEERLRRQEQRKRQQEAAERRANGEMTSGSHKHPLNSERRRANRRKPKWKNTFKVEENKNHNASGFLARRDVPARRNQGY